jgi:hypothetical protein
LKNRMLLLGAIVIVLALGGCASLDMVEPENDQVSLVVGYMDMSDAPATLDWISAKKMSPRTEKPFYNFAVDKGLFWHGHADFGVYKFDSFGGNGGLLSNTRYTFQFPSQGKGDLDFELKVPGVYYIGAFKYVPEKTGLFEPGKFNIVRVSKLTEQEALSRMLKYAGSTKWRDRIMERLNQIGGPVKVGD